MKYNHPVTTKELRFSPTFCFVVHFILKLFDVSFQMFVIYTSNNKQL